ncbi:MAG: SdpI family protein [Chitinophagaceae bacterium]
MNKYFKILIWPIAIIPLLYLFIIWETLPGKIAMHFDLQGKPDRYGDKSALLLMVAILCVVSIGLFFLLSNIYRIDPKKYAAENKDRLVRMAFIISIFMSALSCFIIYSSVKEGFELGIRYVFASVGLLICLLGNYMHTIKPNYFAGFRLPWTLNNEENWRKTHLLGGKLWFAGGLVIAIVCIFLPDQLAGVIFMILMFILVLIPVIYSYRMYKNNNEAENKTPA